MFLRRASALQCFSTATPGSVNSYGKGSHPVVLCILGVEQPFHGDQIAHVLHVRYLHYSS